MDARSEEIGRLLRDQEQAITAGQEQAGAAPDSGYPPWMLWSEIRRRNEAAAAARQQHAAAAAVAQEQRQAGISRAQNRIGRRMKAWLIGEGVALAAGLLFVVIGAEMTNPGINETGGPEVGIGLSLIALSLIGAVVTIIAAAQAHNNDAHPEAYKGKRPLPWVLSLAGCLVSLAIGTAILLTQSGGPEGKSETSVATFFIVAGLLGGAAWLTAGFLYVTRPQRAAYRRWMASLTPQQRAAVYAAQVAGLTLAHEAMKHSNERARGRRAAAQARHDYIHRFTLANINHEPFDEPPPPGMSASWGS